MSRRQIEVALLAVALWIAAGGSAVMAGGAGAAPQAAAGASPGQVTRTATMHGPLSALAELTLVTLATRDSTGRDRAIDATVFTPRAPWTGPGRRPLVGMAVGTYGQGDQCAPSRSFAQPVAVGDGSAQFGYENSSVELLLARGYAVVVPDYIGLGQPGTHTFLNRVDQGHALLDAIRAARTTTGNAGPVAVWGYSQGGVTSAAAAELAPVYAPELPVRAGYAGAPVADAAAVLRRSDSVLKQAIAGWSANSAIASDPTLRQPITAALSSAGNAYRHRLARMCMPDAAIDQLTGTTPDLADDLLAVPGFAAWLAEQRLGEVAPQVPMLVHAGRNDDVVPFGSVTGLVRDWRQRGAAVDLLVFEAPATVPGYSMDHSLPHQLDNVRALDWLAAKLK
ncbi:MAG: alpha/beta fold hydrolase [Gordonia sp. (in: high G+C Gram-positive bacteria)]|uniref:alpha/beta fold hydrolase n=1 Tax=Gordonia sp. (in: high G+C Gram-positive bacteria) TaxID=84139 RepID=UPI003BB5E971